MDLSRKKTPEFILTNYLEGQEQLVFSCLQPLYVQLAFWTQPNFLHIQYRERRKKRQETQGNLLSLKVLLLIRLPILFSIAGSQTQMSSSTFHSLKRCLAGDCLWVCEWKNDRVGQDRIGSRGVTGGTCPCPKSLVSFKRTIAATAQWKANDLFAAILL